jgi:hypothetical protein
MPRAIAPDNDIDNCGLSYDELQELWLGPTHDGSVFNDEQELRDAWIRGRDVVMRLWATNGRRPQAWWHLGDAASLGLAWPGHDREQSYLFEAGVLSESECAELVRSWRREFDRGHKPAHLNWAGVPQSLRQQWQAERKHRGRQPSERVVVGNGTPPQREGGGGVHP